VPAEEVVGGWIVVALKMDEAATGKGLVGEGGSWQAMSRAWRTIIGSELAEVLIA
jgi:hypothetical protein